MSHHVAVRLPDPDGRLAVADYRHPITHVMRRILKTADKGPDRGRPEDYALIAEWLDHCPGEACDMTCRDDTDRHPPATPDPYTPPRYRRPVLNGLW